MFLRFEHPRTFRDHRGEAVDFLRQRQALFRKTTERIEVLKVRGGVGEAHAFVLRSDVRKFAAEFGELRRGHKATIQLGAASTLLRDDAANDDLAVLGHAPLFKQRRGT